MERFLSDVDFMEWNLQQDKGRPFNLAVKELCQRFPQYESYIRAYDLHWEESVPGLIKAGVELAAEVKAQGYKLFGLSNWSREKFDLVKHKYPFFNWFDDILISGDVQLAKPEPQIFQVFLQKVGREAQECLLIDDTQRNLDVASNLGFHVILCQSIAQVRTEMVKLGYLC